MTPQELEQLLEGGTETQRIDFKESMNWNVEQFAKDILAMSNVQGGGYIIIGVKEAGQKFERVGILEEHKNSYKIDIMKDQMSSYADPHVNFKIDFPIDRNGKVYVVIYVFEFEEIPTICRKESDDTKKNIIYYRNRDRRWESAPISNSYDLKDIIERATIKMMRKYKELGLAPEITDKKAEIEKLYKDEIKDLI